MIKCDFCFYDNNGCSITKRSKCLLNDYENFCPEKTEEVSASSTSIINKLINEILQLPTWSDGTVLVVSRDAVINTIRKL